MGQIINYGSCCIDHVFQVPKFVSAGETLSSLGYNVFPGGKGLNQSIALAAAGAKVTHVGAVGSDGEWLIELMKRYGILTDFTSVIEDPSGQAIIQINPEGENAIVILGGANHASHETPLLKAFDAATSDDLLLIQNETQNNPLAIELAKSKGIQVAFNMAPMNDVAQSMPLELIDYFIVNEIEGESLTQENDPNAIVQKLLARYPNAAIVLTLGRAGVKYADATSEFFQPAFPVDVVDTTGAGDTFTGYFLATLTETRQIAHSLKIASAAAALSVTKPGAATSIPHHDDVIAFLN